MIKETYYLLRYGPAIQRRKKELGLVQFMKEMAAAMDAAGYGELRASLVDGLEGDILEVGAGTGATFSYYGPRARVTAIEPNTEFRAAAEEAAKEVPARIHVLPGTGEELPFGDASFDAISASLALCSVASQSKSLAEFKRVLRPGGQIRLMEHVRSEHWLAGPLMVLLNPLWLRMNQIGCNWHRRTVESVRRSGFTILSVERHKIYAVSSPTAFPIRIIKAVRPA